MAMAEEDSPQAEIRNEKPLNELLTSSMVSIYVGQENTHWYLHERLLCYYSPFFASIFYADDKNADNSPDKQKARKNKAYGLSDEEDLSFEMLVGWLYSRSLKHPQEEKEVGPLLDLYLLSEKLEMEKLSSEICDAVSDWYYSSSSYPGLRRVQYIYANTDEDNAMRDMMVGAIAKQLTTADKIPSHWASALGRNGQLAVDIIRAIQQWHIEEKTIPDARDPSVGRGRSKSAFTPSTRDGNSATPTSNMGVESINSEHEQESDDNTKAEDSEA